jgi:hypothetical protein
MSTAMYVSAEEYADTLINVYLTKRFFELFTRSLVMAMARQPQRRDQQLLDLFNEASDQDLPKVS